MLLVRTALAGLRHGRVNHFRKVRHAPKRIAKLRHYQSGSARSLKFARAVTVQKQTCSRSTILSENRYPLFGIMP
jgi:hypothetical protein